MSSTSSPKRRQRLHKKVVSIPIKGEDRSRNKSHTSPTFDSWAWRKYGQKPIKGSPYPRGYYRCSSWKGCPARKQVERSHVDPTTMVVTYSGEHNHQNNHRNSTFIRPEPAENSENLKLDPAIEPEEKFPDMSSGEFGWFGGMETTSYSNLIESPIFAASRRPEDEVAVCFPMREEDELLFADLGELPECSTVLMQIGVGP